MPSLKQMLAKAPTDAIERARLGALLEQRVVAVKKTGAPCSGHPDLYQPWPGPHEHVRTWYVLDNGKAIGVNEDPDKGWSFPVVDYDP